DVEHAGERLGLVADDPDAIAAESGEAADDALGEERLQLQELAVVDHHADDVFDVVRLRRLVRDEGVELGGPAGDRVHRIVVGRRVRVRLRQEAEEVARVLERGLLVGRRQVRNTRLGRVRGRAAELLEAHVLAGDRLHHVGAGDEHVRRSLHHQYEVGDRGRVDGAPGARAHDEGDLRHDTRGLDVAPEDLRVAGERDDALLDPRAAGVVDADDGAPVLHGQVHDLADLLREHLRERAAEHREVLREDEDLAAQDGSVPGDHGVPPGPVVTHPELDLAMTDEAIELDARARVEELLYPLAREQLAALSLTLDVALTRMVARVAAQFLEPAEFRFGRLVDLRHRRSLTPHLGAGDSFAAVGGAPIDRSTTWPYGNGEPTAFTYSRFSSPTLAEAERALGSLAGGAARLFPSASGACTSLVLALLSAGQTVAIAEGAYYGTGVMLDELSRWGVQKVEFDQTGPPPDSVDLVWLEAPSNPFLTMPNFEAAAEHPARVVCDSTAATPLNVRPLALGCDVAVHSATKYLAGHDDALAGAAVCGHAQDAARLREFRSRTGPVPAADTAWLVLRGLQTLEVRLAR